MGIDFDAANLFEPDVIVPSQFITQATASWSGERKLMLAVLEEALGTIFRHVKALTPSAKQAIDDAKDWVESDDELHPFSFINVCEAVGLNPSALRRGIHLAPTRSKQVNVWDFKRKDFGGDDVVNLSRRSRVRYVNVSAPARSAVGE